MKVKTRITLRIQRHWHTSLFLALILGVFSSCSKPVEKVVDGKLLQINGSEIYYRTMGEGDPLVFVHGGPLLGHSYLLPHLEELAEDYQLIFYDQRAAGRSSPEVVDSTMTLDGFADDIELIRQKLDLGKINLLAHSWGGLIAMKYAMKYDENLDHLILSNSIAPNTLDNMEDEIAIGKKMAKEDRDRLDKLTSSGLLRTEDPSEAIKEMMMISYRVHMFDVNNIDKLDFYIPKDFFVRSETYAWMSYDMNSYNFNEKLNEVSTPTLVLYGESETAVDLFADRMAESFMNSELYVVKGSGHFPFIESKTDYIEKIRSFITK